MKSVLITGANRGIGLGFVRQLCLSNPAPQFIFASCRAPQKAKELQAIAADHSNVHILEIDVQNEATYGPALEKIQNLVGSDGLTVLINNAAINTTDDYETVSRQTLTDILDVNLVSPIRLTQTFLPLIRQAARSSAVSDYSVERAAVINLTSGFASIGGYMDGTRRAGYRESKVALNIYTKGLSLDMRADKVLVLSIVPGWTRTAMGMMDGANPTKPPQQAAAEMLNIFRKVSEEQNGMPLKNELPLRPFPF